MRQIFASFSFTAGVEGLDYMRRARVLSKFVLKPGGGKVIEPPITADFREPPSRIASFSELSYDGRVSFGISEG